MSDFLVQLDHAKSLVDDLHFSKEKGRFSYMKLTKDASGYLMCNWLPKYFSFLRSKPDSNITATSQAEDASLDASTYDPGFILFIHFLALQDPQRAPYQLDNPLRIHVTPKQVDAFLDHDNRSPRQLYGLNRKNWTGIFDRSGISWTRIEDAIEIPGSVDYYSERFNAH
jgi:hypothetical protein